MAGQYPPGPPKSSIGTGTAPEKSTPKPTAPSMQPKNPTPKRPAPQKPIRKRPEPKGSALGASAQTVSALNQIGGKSAPLLPKSIPQKTAKTKQAYFEDDDQDDEEPLLPRADSEIKQEIKPRASNQVRRASMPATGATTVTQSGAPVSEKAKKRARLNLELEAMEIEEQQLEIKKSKVMLKRQLLQLDEED